MFADFFHVSYEPAGLLSLLNEPEPDLQAYAIHELNKSVDEFWTEIADNISTMCVVETLIQASLRHKVRTRD